MSLVVFLLVPLPSATKAQTPAVVLAPGSTNYGKTYPEWLASWAQWASSLETIHHPLYDTADLSAGQSGAVWFLGRHWGAQSKTRTGVIPANKALYVTVTYAYADNSGCPPGSSSEAELAASAEGFLDSATNDLTFTVDGVAVTNLLTSYRFQTPAFTFVTPPNNNYLEANEKEPCYSDQSPTPTPWTIVGAVDAGICVMLAPLPVGPHTIHFGNQGGDVTYNITAVSTNLGNPGVFPPDSAPYGKTYAQWAAEKWKWFYSLPIDRNPLFDTADISAGQSSNLWFLGAAGNYTTNADGVIWGTAVRAATVPDGTALLVPLIEKESATAEGNGDLSGQLFANSQFYIDRATNLACAIDGQLVQNLEHYRSQSSQFTWGPLPANNVFGDPAKFPQGLTSQSAVDGYYLILSPPAAGAHTLHFTGGIKTSTANGDPLDYEYETDITYNLTVTPASLSIEQQGTNLVISWPQTGTSYALEETDSLSVPHWSPEDGSVQAVGSTYEATIPFHQGNRFFRLRKQ